MIAKSENIIWVNDFILYGFFLLRTLFPPLTVYLYERFILIFSIEAE